MGVNKNIVELNVDNEGIETEIDKNDEWEVEVNDQMSDTASTSTTSTTSDEEKSDEETQDSLQRIRIQRASRIRSNVSINQGKAADGMEKKHNRKRNKKLLSLKKTI